MRRLKISEDYISAIQKQFGTVCKWGKKGENAQRVEIQYKYFVTAALTATSSPTMPRSILLRDKKGSHVDFGVYGRNGVFSLYFFH